MVIMFRFSFACVQNACRYQIVHREAEGKGRTCGENMALPSA